jgi:hypothetical protein
VILRVYSLYKYQNRILAFGDKKYSELDTNFLLCFSRRSVDPLIECLALVCICSFFLIRLWLGPIDDVGLTRLV